MLVSLFTAVIVGFAMLSSVFAIPIISDLGDDLVARSRDMDVKESNPTESSSAITLAVTFVKPSHEANTKSRSAKIDEDDEKAFIEYFVKTAVAQIQRSPGVYEVKFEGTMSQDGTDTEFTMQVQELVPPKNVESHLSEAPKSVFMGTMPTGYAEKNAKAVLKTGKGKLVLALELSKICTALAKVCT